MVEREVYGGDGGGGDVLTGDGLAFHRGFVKLPFSHRVLLANHYIDPHPQWMKARALRISSRSWWRRLHSAHLSIALRIDECA